MNKKERRKMFQPKKCALYENGELIEVFDSHRAAKTAKYFKQKEADDNMLDLEYEIKPYKRN